MITGPEAAELARRYRGYGMSPDEVRRALALRGVPAEEIARLVS